MKGKKRSLILVRAITWIGVILFLVLVYGFLFYEVAA